MVDRYPFPPITEAIIEFRFESEIDEVDRSKISSKFEPWYPNQSQIEHNTFHLDLEQGTAEKRAKVFMRRSSEDETEIVLIGPASFAVSQLAVYPGWAPFFERVRRDWTEWKRFAGYRKLARIGTRYINRLDVPSSAGFVRHEEYLNLYPHVGESIPLIGPYAMQVQVPLPNINSGGVINSASVDSPMPDCSAYIVDIDIGRDAGVPQKDKEIFDYLRAVREEKNRIFEASITDLARERFFHEG